MYNPEFTKTIQMCQTIANSHVGELLTLDLEWKELKDADGQVYQIVPILRAKFKF
jgi:hypothetical protein